MPARSIVWAKEGNLADFQWLRDRSPTLNTSFKGTAHGIMTSFALDHKGRSQRTVRKVNFMERLPFMP